MSQVTFHVNAPHRLGYTCRLLRKAAGLGARVVVTGPPETLDRLDVALWTFSALEFVPHCRASAPAAVLNASPVVLAADWTQAPQAAVLLNLGDPLWDGAGQTPGGGAPASFAKIIEVFGQGDDQVQQARQRWRAYKAQGHDLLHHDILQPSP